MTTARPEKIYLSNYTPPAFEIESAELFFDLHEDQSRVRSILKFQKIGTAPDLFLDGADLELVSVRLQGELLSPSQYLVSEHGLLIKDVPTRFTVEILVHLYPQKNTSLEGLYRSGDLFTTQCEAQGFRKITYFIDRPDVLTKYVVHIEADKKRFPYLLSNGNRRNHADLPNGRHLVTWEDPHKKPCYLFALVAGDLGVIKDQFTTQSGKSVQLEIYCAHGDQARCQFAMQSLIKSMKWDEERFGREYDLDIYMIVAVDDFNAGAMENKGLNIFNSRLVLADATTATDANYFAIESVIGHEYFHNWTGNRVTLRDWFHLSLKEGLTVFRDQEFSMDLHSRPMVRIECVDDLRNGQFAEDAGPNAHPIRPDSCYSVDNFFTSTIYEKGAEVIRMMQTMVGRPGFRKGMDLYFKRHDGQAVIIEDFAKAIADANDQKWDQFKLWYSQAGTPIVQIRQAWDQKNNQLHLSFEQSCPLTASEKSKEPFHIPLVLGFVLSSGQDLEVLHPEIIKNSEGQLIFHLKQARQDLILTQLSERPILSINRGFSAPIHLQLETSQDDLLFLLAHDSDAFNRWESCQTLMSQELAKLIQASKKQEPLLPSPKLFEALTKALNDPSLDLNLKAKLIELPSDAYLWQLESEFCPAHFKRARACWEIEFARFAETTLANLYSQYHGQHDQSLHHAHMAERKLANQALKYLCLLANYQPLALTQFESARHMTDQEAAFQICLEQDPRTRRISSEQFFNQWKHDSLTLNKWFACLAEASTEQTAQTVKDLWNHESFNPKNPNRVYALLGRFGANLSSFHENNGEHYSWMSERILELDRLNPQVATRIASAFNKCTKLGPDAKKAAAQCLSQLLGAGLSKNTFEIVSRTHDSLMGLNPELVKEAT